jgi:AcrR family transcriptional regulator
MVKLYNEQKHADQKACLLAHVRRLFAVQGVKETSMSQAAKACKVTKATLYHYFRSKEDILKEILDCRSRDIEKVSQTLKTGTLEECLSQIARNHLDQMGNPENLECMKIMLSETMKNNEMRKFYMDFLHQNIGMGAQALTPFAHGKKNEKELRLLFFQFMATLVHYVWNVKMVGDPSGFIGDEETFVKQLVKTYTAAIQTT